MFEKFLAHKCKCTSNGKDTTTIPIFQMNRQLFSVKSHITALNPFPLQWCGQESRGRTDKAGRTSLLRQGGRGYSDGAGERSISPMLRLREPPAGGAARHKQRVS